MKNKNKLNFAVRSYGQKENSNFAKGIIDQSVFCIMQTKVSVILFPNYLHLDH